MEFPRKTRKRYPNIAKYFLIASAPVGPIAPPFSTPHNQTKSKLTLFIMNCEIAQAQQQKPRKGRPRKL